MDKVLLPVIFLTSAEAVIDEVLAFQIGADDFIRKPFSERLLVERVKAVLRRSSPNDGQLQKKLTTNVLECGALRMDAERAISAPGKTSMWHLPPLNLFFCMR